MDKLEKKEIKEKIEEESIYDEYRYKRWRQRVYKRDGYGCQFPNCKFPHGKLNAHHIKMKWYHPELIYSIKNGISLCEYHHGYIHRQGSHKYEEKLEAIAEHNGKHPIIRLKRVKKVRKKYAKKAKKKTTRRR